MATTSPRSTAELLLQLARKTRAYRNGARIWTEDNAWQALFSEIDARLAAGAEEPVATVVDNDPDWHTIIEPAPNVTLEAGTKLYAHPPAPQPSDADDQQSIADAGRSLHPQPEPEVAGVDALTGKPIFVSPPSPQPSEASWEAASDHITKEVQAFEASDRYHPLFIAGMYEAATLLLSAAPAPAESGKEIDIPTDAALVEKICPYCYTKYKTFEFIPPEDRQK